MLFKNLFCLCTIWTVTLRKYHDFLPSNFCVNQNFDAMTGCVKCHVYFSTFVFANESWFYLCRVLSLIFYWFGMVRRKLTIPPYQKGGKLLACITVVLAIEGWQTTSGLTIPLLYDWCCVFVKRGMLLTVHAQVDLAKRRRERTGSYPDGRGNGRSVQLVHFVVI